MPFRLPLNLCHYCRHKHKRRSTCEAYPAGIPEDIRRMEVIHRKPHPGDQGITFQPREDMDKCELDRRVDEVEYGQYHPTVTRYAVGTPIWDVLSDDQREAIRRLGIEAAGLRTLPEDD